jgi:phosphatidylinositol glycan class B
MWTLLKSVNPTRFFWTCALGSLALHLVGAWVSWGPHHPDEHYQILEFMNALLGRRQFQDLPWEYHWKIRPWLQPMFYGWISNLWSLIGIDNVWTWTLSFRLISAVFAWASLMSVAWAAQGTFRSLFWERATWVMLFGFGLFPYLGARTSSENFGGAFFWIGAGLLARAVLRVQTESHGWRYWLGVGALLALSCWFRAQCGLFVLGLVAWWLFVSKAHATHRHFLEFTIGFLMVSVVGVVADRIGYGEWVFTPWRYIDANVIQGVAKQFGVQHPLAYVAWLPGMFPPFSTIFWIACAVFIAKFRRHWATWAVFPFIAAHFAMAHKETRFFFPMMAILPLMTGWVLDEIQPRWTSWSQTPRWFRAFAVVLLTANALGFVFSTFRVRVQNVRVAEFFYRQNPREFTYYTFGGQDFNIVVNLPSPYYLPDHTRPIVLRSWADLEVAIRTARAKGESLWFLNNDYGFPPEAPHAREGCTLAFQNYPQSWFQSAVLSEWIRTWPYVVFKCK